MRFVCHIAESDYYTLYVPQCVLSTIWNVVEPDQGTVEAEDVVCPELALDLAAEDTIPLEAAQDTPEVLPIRVMFLVPLTDLLGSRNS